jgi:hypothetical protein
MISDQGAENYFLPQKPAFANAEFACPNCGNKDTYEHTDLLYRA